MAKQAAPETSSPPESKPELLKCMTVTVELALMVLLIKAYRLESAAFHDVMFLLVVTFPVHHLLPKAFRLPLFAAISIASVIIVFGWATGSWLIAISVAFIGLCHLPVPFRARVVLICCAGLVLAALRTDWIQADWLRAIWPVVGSMFMFRVIVYLYDMKNRTASFDLWKALAYFFLIPNVCFVLFPIVDYRTFCRTYYNEIPFRIYQIGVQWIFRGIVHLILYRVVYQYLSVDPMEIVDAGDVYQYMVATFMLYLKVSGSFHIIIGVLHLFGFNLPEASHLYVLSSSFTDWWRRVNIYWKEFITKVCFYPLYLKMRTLGPTKSLVIATALTFFATWFLHSYQWFWLRGTPLLTPVDMAFWAILGLLVVVNVAIESRAKKKKKGPASAKENVVLALKTIATFTTLVTLWSLWTSESFAEWFAILSSLSVLNVKSVVTILGIWLAIGVAAIFLRDSKREWTEASIAAQRAAQGPYNFWVPAVRVCATSVVVGVVALGSVQSYLPRQIASFLESIEVDQLNRQDVAKFQRGYYEDLMDVERFSAELSELYNQRPADYFKPWRAVMNIEGGDFIGRELPRSTTYEYLGVTYNTNQWGLRDKEYSPQKPPNVYRIALLGTSFSMGWGIGDTETYENIVEDRLNAELPGDYEILNFSVNGHGPLRKLAYLDKSVLAFQPDMAVFVCNRIEKQWIVDQIVNSVRREAEIPFEFVSDRVAEAGVTSDMQERPARIRLAKHSSELMDWTFREFVKRCKENNIKPVWMFMPEIQRLSIGKDPRVEEAFALAESAGFEAILDLSPSFEKVSPQDLILAPWDGHPNVRGHSLLANQFFDLLTANEAILLTPAEPAP